VFPTEKRSGKNEGGKKMSSQHVRQLFLALTFSIPLCGCLAAGLPLELLVAGGSEAAGLGGAAAIKSGSSGGGLFGPGRTMVPNAMLIFWQKPVSGDPRVVADIKPGDAQAAQQAYASALLPAHSGDCDRPFRPKVITDTGDRDHVVCRPEGRREGRGFSPPTRMQVA
jgi:hypothetical protein